MRQTLCWLVGGALCLGLGSMSMAAESGCRAEFVTARGRRLPFIIISKNHLHYRTRGHTLQLVALCNPIT
jgi:hypothetical protein